MKRLVVFLGLVALCVSTEVLEERLKKPGDNSHYVEGTSRYIWMSDGDGKPILVDLHEPVDEAQLSSRNGTNGAQNQYWLFTRRNPSNRQIIINGNAASIEASNYLGSRPTMVIVHGWNNNGNSPLNNLITSAFLAQLDCNVIVVDWSGLASSNYNTAVQGVPRVGHILGKFLVWLFNTTGGDWNQVHLVGHSLGAHVVGNAGRAVGRLARRITGLDPAGPQWDGNANALASDAGVYVESIHTDGRGLGIYNPISHVDFYPNRGMHPQPGCFNSICSHDRANYLFASTVLYNRLVGKRCLSTPEAEHETLHMGNNIMTKSGTGIYRLHTSSIWPF